MTKEGAYEAIQTLLGSSFVQVELEKPDVEKFFKIAEMKCAPYISEYRLVTLPATKSIDLSTYDVAVVLEVMEASNAGAGEPAVGSDPMLSKDIFGMMPIFGGVPNSSLLVDQMLINSFRSDFRSRASKNYRFEKGVLYLDAAFAGSVTIKYTPQLDFDNLSDSKWKSWIYEYVLALCKVAVGRIRSKIRSTNLPIELDGDTLLSEGNEKVRELEDNLASLGEGNFIITR